MDLILLNGEIVKHYQIDQVPAYEQAKNLAGFIAWDIVEPTTHLCSEGLSYTNGNSLVISSDLILYIYSNRLDVRSGLLTAVLDILQPKVSGKRTFLKGLTLTNGFIRHLVLTEQSDYPVSKTGQSTPELSASVMTFTYSISIVED